MGFGQSLQYLKDRISSLEKELRETSSHLKEEMAKNYKIMMGLLILESIPTLQALGLPVKEIIPGAIKLLLGFLHF